MTKTKAVFGYMLVNDHIEPMVAINEFGATRLSAIIFNLKEYGVDIETRTVEATDKLGNICQYASYKIVDKDKAWEIYNAHFYGNRFRRKEA